MQLTRAVNDLVNDIAKDPSLNGGIVAMQDRADEFGGPLTPKLVGTYIDPQARAVFDKRLDETWSKTGIPTSATEIIIGGGLHAAIYCAVRVREGAPKPLVIEASDRVGGAFAASSGAAFYLNSTNRPGDLGTPGRQEALNYLPGAVIQPSDLGGEEYQTNAALAFSIRATLAAAAKVLPGHRVTQAKSDGVVLENGRQIKAARVIYATGLGQPKGPTEIDGGHLQNYMQFIATLDQPFPLRGLKRVAVVGAGDSGKTAIEALIGQGPPMPYSLSALDWPEMIDWYGVPETCTNKAGWLQGNRSRYKGIARVLPRNTGQPETRVKAISRKAENVGVGYNGAYVDGARYDLVIWCAGFEAEKHDGQPYKVGGREVARMKESNVLVIGPASALEVGFDANVNGVTAAIPENTAAVFRYADRTAALAMALPQLELPNGSQPNTVPLGGKIEFVTLANDPFAVPDKTDPKNWAPGDRLKYTPDSTGKSGATVLKALEGGSVTITNEVESDGSVSFKFPASRTIGVPNDNWVYSGPGDVPVEDQLDKSKALNWRKGDRIRRDSDGVQAIVAEVDERGRVRIEQEGPRNGSLRPENRIISSMAWSYVQPGDVPPVDKTRPEGWAKGDQLERVSDGATATVRRAVGGNVTVEKASKGTRVREIRPELWRFVS